jgi:hypothetical protein
MPIDLYDGRLKNPHLFPRLRIKTGDVNAPAAAGTLFDDFSCTDQRSMINHSWIIRTELSWPGVPDAVWARNSVSFVDDANPSGNRQLRMTSTTNGTATRQTQL